MLPTAPARDSNDSSLAKRIQSLIGESRLLRAQSADPGEIKQRFVGMLFYWRQIFSVANRDATQVLIQAEYAAVKAQPAVANATSAELKAIQDWLDEP